MTTYPEFHQPAQPGWGAAVRKVISNDIGPKYAAVSLVVEFADGQERLMDAMPYCLTEGSGSGLPSIDEVCINIVTLFLGPERDWIWNGSPPFITERQMDHLAYMGLVGDSGSGEKGKKSRARGKPPICYAIYGMLRMLVTLKARPNVLFTESDLVRFVRAGIDPRTLGQPELRFVPVSGHQKAGLKGKKGSERKGGDAYEIALEMMEEAEDEKARDYVQSLSTVGDIKKKKPRQDVIDTYLQGRRYLADKREEERKALKRTASAALGRSEAKGASAPKKVKK